MAESVIPLDSRPTQQLSRQQISNEFAQDAHSLQFGSLHRFKALTWEETVDFHLNRIKFDDEGNERSSAVIRNHRSVINDFICRLPSLVTSLEENITGSSIAEISEPVDLVFIRDELGPKFGRYLFRYEKALNKDEKSKRTIADRRSIIRSFRESFLELRKSVGAGGEFAEVLRFLVQSSPHSVPQIAARTEVHHEKILYWSNGSRTPQEGSLPDIRKLEEFFELPASALSSRIPDVWWYSQRCIQTGNTPWREHQRKAIAAPYRLRDLPDRVRREYGDLFLFYTDPDWAEDRGLKTNSEWRIRWNRESCPTGDMLHETLYGFFGFLCLSKDEDNPWLRGLGFDREALSLAMFGSVEYVKAFIEFRRERNLKKIYTSETKYILSCALMLVRPETGFLWQQPEYRACLPTQVSEDEWRDWCGRSHSELKKIKRRIFGKNKKSKNKAGREQRHGHEEMGKNLSRDPFAGVREYIVNLQYPISVLWDLADNMTSVCSLIKKSKFIYAGHIQSLFLCRMIPSNPLRRENYAMMTFIPKDWEAFRKACELYQQMGDYRLIYVETDPDSNLYQTPDKSWHLRFNPEDFKNQVGAASEPYDVPIVEDVWPSLVEHLFRQRLVLLDNTKHVINKVREKRGVAPLSAKEEMRIDQCPYVLRTKTTEASLSRNKKWREFTGAEMISGKRVSDFILRSTRRFLPGCPGFGAHACRHLVASHYIKNNPDGWQTAAAALHATIATVKKHYAWVRSADKIRPWNEHYMELKRRHDAGELAA